MAKIKAKKSEEITQEVVETKGKKIKQEKYQSEESLLIKNFIIVLCFIIVVVVIFYFITKAVVDKRTTTPNSEPVAGEINYDIASVGTILNRPYDNYYVMVYDGEDAEAIYYSALITNYMDKEDGKKIYYCDLSNELNKEYKAETSNPNAKSVEEFAFGKLTLLEIQDGKVKSYIEDENRIKEILQ